MSHNSTDKMLTCFRDKKLKLKPSNQEGILTQNLSTISPVILAWINDIIRLADMYRICIG